jgi:pimeloyl-ACP methyl ester carboxylesterase
VKQLAGWDISKAVQTTRASKATASATVHPPHRRQREEIRTLGDRDGIRVEHAVEMYRLIPNSQLAAFPNATHFLIFQDPDKSLGTVVSFLDAPTTNDK